MKKNLLGRILTISLVSISTLSLAAVTLAWFVGPGGKTKEHIDGVIGLRGYFYSGDGRSSETAFEIVRPQHLYNLSRLQSLGVFADKTYFKIGHVDDPNEGPYCLDEDGVKRQYLDMQSFCATTPLAPIGNEETPFVGEFEGNGIPVKNLVVKGNPEDIGVFGYVSFEGKVNGLVCSELDIHSLGYASSGGMNSLFGQDIDDIFDSNSDYLATETSFYMHRNSDVELKSQLLNESGGTTLTNLSSDLVPGSQVYNGAYFYPQFPNKAIHPDDRFSYTWKSSSSLLRASDDDPNKIVIDLDRFPSTSRVGAKVDTRVSLIASVSQNNYTYSRVIQSYSFQFSLEPDHIYRCKNAISPARDFDEDDWVEVGATIFSDTSAYLVGDIVLADDGFYICTQDVALPDEGETNEIDNTHWAAINHFSSTSEYVQNDYVYTSGDVEVTILCDYIKENNEFATNYHHGTNIGFLAGHVDGSITQSFVYNGRFHLNTLSANNKVSSESDTGLIGEIGNNVTNTLDPEYSLTTNGDTGVINFSKIYNGIRSDFAIGDTVMSGQRTTGSGDTNYVSYENFVKDGQNGRTMGDYYDLYKNYLRYYYWPEQAGNHYITGVSSDVKGTSPKNWHTYTITQTDIDENKRVNSIDLLWNQIIADDEENNEDRGLGVFKIVTTRNASANMNNYSTYQYDNLGGTQIVNGLSKTKVYFSTAEYVHRYLDENKQWKVLDANQPAWGTAANQIQPLRAATIPTYTDSSTFQYPFSRDHDYCFELDLSKMDSSAGKNYMWNTTNPFLQNYLSSILIDKTGKPVKPRTMQFGFMFLSDKKEKLYSLSSYMRIKKPDKTVAYGDGNYYPSNSIVFEIENSNGANVSVVGNGGDITIYSYDPTVNNYAPLPLYTMRSANSINYTNTQDGQSQTSDKHKKDLDYHRFFTYDVATGATSESAKSMCYMDTCTYKVGDIVYYNPTAAAGSVDPTKWYVCNTNISTPELWTSSHWDAIPDHSSSIPYEPGDLIVRNGLLFKAKVHIDSGQLFSKNYDKWEIIDTRMHDENALYGHIFKLPKGHYVIGAESGANLYFLAVQGQKKGTITTDETPSGLVDNTIEDVDFLLNEPTYEEYKNYDFENYSNNTLSRAFFTFEANFNDFNYDSVFYTTNNNNYMQINFTKTPAFVSYLYLHCRAETADRKYYINNDEPYDTTDLVYPYL